MFSLFTSAVLRLTQTSLSATSARVRFKYKSKVAQKLNQRPIKFQKRELCSFLLLKITQFGYLQPDFLLFICLLSNFSCFYFFCNVSILNIFVRKKSMELFLKMAAIFIVSYTNVTVERTKVVSTCFLCLMKT